MNKEVEGEFRGTSFVFSDPSDIPAVLREFATENELYNQESILFNEERYINEADNFRDVLDKFMKKNFEQKVWLYQEQSLKPLPDFSKELNLFKKVLEDNNIDGLKKNELRMAINHFSSYTFNDKVKMLKEIYLLLFFATSTRYVNNHFLFTLSIESDRLQLDGVYPSVSSKVELDLAYEWVIESLENISTRLRIVREILIRRGKFVFDGGALENAKSIFNRVIKEQTEKYFEQVNTLKNDFLIISNQETASYLKFNLSVFGWFSALALFIYKQAIDFNFNNGDIITAILFSDSQRTKLFVVMFLIAAIYIWEMFNFEMYLAHKRYVKIKEFYQNQLFFKETDFENYINEPAIKLCYQIGIRFVVAVLVIRLILP